MNRQNFCYLALLLTLLFGALKFLQLQDNPVAYPSDLGMHVRFAVEEDSGGAAGYSMLHFVGKVGMALLEGPGVDDWMAVRISYLMLLMGTFYFSLIMVHELLQRRSPESPIWRTASLAVALLYLSMIIIPESGGIYIGIWTPNPWHNPTYTLARVFALLVVLGFLEAIQENKIFDWWRWASIALAASLSMWSKPSFMMFLLPAAAVILIWLKLRGGNSWRQVTWIGSAFLPSVGVLLIVQQFVYGVADPSNQVIIAPGKAWGIYAPNLILSIVLGSAFPLFVAAVRVRSMDRSLAFVLLGWFFAISIALLFAESGDRFTHANFIWTYMGGLFFAFMLSAESWFIRQHSVPPWLWWFGTLIFSAHLFSGLTYFLKILRGGSYF